MSDIIRSQYKVWQDNGEKESEEKSVTIDRDLSPQGKLTIKCVLGKVSGISYLCFCYASLNHNYIGSSRNLK